MAKRLAAWRFARHITALIQANSILAIPAALYIALAVSFLVSRNFSPELITADFHFYHSYWHKYIEWLSKSDYSVGLYQQSTYGNQQVALPAHRVAWVPNPIYAVMALWPITILGSPILFFGIGLGLGISCIYLLNRLLELRFDFLTRNAKLAILCLFAINPYFAVESSGVSTNGIACLLVLFTISRSTTFASSAGAAAVMASRPNSIFLLVGSLASCMIFMPAGLSRFIKISSLAAGIYACLYAVTYSTYPGSVLNYTFIDGWPGIHYITKHSANTFTSIKGLSPDEIFSLNMSIKEYFSSIFESTHSLNFVFQALILKLSVFLGLGHEQSFISRNDGSIGDAFCSLYSVLVVIPGFYAAAFLSVKACIKRSARSSLIHAMYLAALLFAIINSLFLGVARMSIPVFALYVVALIDLVSTQGKEPGAEEPRLRPR